MPPVILKEKQKRDFSLNYPWQCLTVIVISFLPFLYMAINAATTSNIIGDGTSLYFESKQTVLHKSVSSPLFKQSLLLSIVLAIPMMVDTFLDCSMPQEHMLWCSRGILICAIVLPNFIMLIGNFDSRADEIYLYAHYFTRIAEHLQKNRLGW